MPATRRRAGGEVVKAEVFLEQHLGQHDDLSGVH